MTRRIGGWRWIAGLLAGLAVALPVFALPFVQPLLVVAVFCVHIAAQASRSW